MPQGHAGSLTEVGYSAQPCLLVEACARPAQAVVGVRSPTGKAVG